MATRDRRWCQGNLQHVRLLFTEGLFGAHRALFLNGALSYVSALLWFSFLLLSTAEAIRFALTEPDYFPAGRALFPQWPVWRPDWAFMLLASAMARVIVGREPLPARFSSARAQSQRTGKASATRQKAEAKAGTPASAAKRTKSGDTPIAQAPPIRAVRPKRSMGRAGVVAV